MKIRLAIIGSRSFNDYEAVLEVVNHILEENKWELVLIVSGGAKGADAMAEKLAEDWDCPIKIYPADWDTYGKRAGFMRNVDIVENSDVVVAFWDGQSKGTQHSINLAREKNKELFIYNYKQ